MRITCLMTFLDGTDRFEAGDSRTVDEERGQRFIDAGWASTGGDGAEVTDQGEPTLTINNSVIGMGDSNG